MRALAPGARRAWIGGALAALALSGGGACTSLSGVGDLVFGAGQGGGGAGQGGVGQGGVGQGGAVGSGAGSTGGGGASEGGAGAGEGGAGEGGTGGGGDGGSGGAGEGGAGEGGAGGGQAPGPPTAAELLALTASCRPASSGLFRNAFDGNAEPGIPVCGLNGAYFWQAGMGIDCDGLSHESSECPSSTAHTALADSQGNALDSVHLPFVVAPNSWPDECDAVAWNHRDAGVELGAVVAVIRGDTVAYGILGDTGECDTIGMGSYAMAQAVGIERPGAGVESGVTYIAFAGPRAVVDPVEDHAKAEELGIQLAAELLAAP
ncbi:glycoside hydrolase family 75 protein [Sorangium sp. So ce302]|uniref:glycoside hydrolase family 75 protein n=1 Tax=Sorangium sp. So ce302 TaxID=3133297 RepID=UPI003F621325